MQIEDNAIILSNHWGWIEPTSPLERPFDKSSLRIPAMFSENYVAHSQAKRPNINQINSPKTDDEPSLVKEPVLRHGRDCLPRLATNLSTVVPHQFAMKLFSLSLIAISSMAMGEVCTFMRRPQLLTHFQTCSRRSTAACCDAVVHN